MDAAQIHYTVVATDDSTKKAETVDFSFDVHPSRRWPHSAHLTEIMRTLDDRYLTLVSIQVGSA